MALFHCQFHSESLGLACSMDVIIPQRTTSQIGMAGAATDPQNDGPGHRTLYLLHGYSDDHTIWQRRTSIERYVAPTGLAVVMPAVNKSYYTDMAFGDRYWTFISEEVPALARQFFRLSARREDNFVAGLSMGGYGAFKLALRCPEKFAAAASMSGVLDIQRAVDHARKNEPQRARSWQMVFGDDPPPDQDDLLALLEQHVAKGTDLPRLYQCCGTEDFLYQHNLNFRDKAKQLGVELTYEEDEGCAHTWDYWDLAIQRALRFFRVGPVGK